MERALTPARVATVDNLVGGEGEPETDELGMVSGLRFAVPLGLGIWAVLIWSVVHFLV